MTELLQRKHYLDEFKRFRDSAQKGAAARLFPVRQAAISRFAEIGFPPRKDEEWKYTDVAPIAAIPFVQFPEVTSGSVGELLAQHRVPGLEGPLLVFLDGVFQPEVSKIRTLPQGVRIGNLAVALEEYPEEVEPLVRVPEEAQAFSALNTAFFRHGAFIQLPPSAVLTDPVQLVFLSSGQTGEAAAYYRNLIVAGANSQATFVEVYGGAGETPYLTNVVTDVRVGANANIDHYKLQQEALQAFHISLLEVHMEASSRYRNHFSSLGGGLVRNEIVSTLDAEGCDCTLNGLFHADGDRHVDNHTTLNHAKPHCNSWEVYRGILNDRAHGIFSGKIVVYKDAQKTDAKQSNSNLLLSPNADATTRPRLEIYADDVRCTHGATVGQLDKDALFYLRSRGIPLQEARNLLTRGFASEVINEISVEPLREHVEQLFMERLARGGNCS
ncbi:MAG: Fe-S cluster assembly protein SufD [Planctomycetota bacterium]